MKGFIILNNIALSCLIGVYPQERKVKQQLVVNIRFMQQIPKEDRLDETIDYDKIVAICEKVAEQETFHLIESFAQALYLQLMQTFDLAKLIVSVTKPLAHATATIEIGVA